MKHILVLTVLFFPSLSLADDFGIGAKLVPTSTVKSNPDFKEIALPPRDGLLVVETMIGSPAREHQLQFGSVIAAVDGKAVTTLSDWEKAIAEKKEVVITGYSSTPNPKDPKGKPFWKKGDLKIQVRPMRDLYLGTMQKSEDKFEGTAFYHHKNSAGKTENSELHIYFEFRNGKAENLRLRIQLITRRFFGAEQFTVKIGEKKFAVKPKSYSDVSREIIGAGKCGEWYDIPLSGDLRNALESVRGSTEVMIRSESDEDVLDRTAGREEKQMISDMFINYRILNGT